MSRRRLVPLLLVVLLATAGLGGFATPARAYFCPPHQSIAAGQAVWLKVPPVLRDLWHDDSWSYNKNGTTYVEYNDLRCLHKVRAEFLRWYDWGPWWLHRTLSTYSEIYVKDDNIELW